jgi:hypothetical protein
LRSRHNDAVDAGQIRKEFRILPLGSFQERRDCFASTEPNLSQQPAAGLEDAAGASR